ncbi:hypothetical protein DSM112329_00102 [Paraconexibacter sp. AEG42_29]|uniref:Ferritin-like domain-containing protein n=1 Tax=Paraconexibacter sp. AEG42_29 TaxID=2997339 RepID=A0AAU7ANS3_9ACTN
MSGSGLTRRALLVAGAGTGAALLSGCEDDVPVGSATANDEAALLRDLVVVEQAQVVVYEAAARRAGGAARRRWTAQAQIEREHLRAIGDVLYRLGARAPKVVTGTPDLPRRDSELLGYLADLEERSAAAWRSVIPRVSQDIVRIACVSIMGVEIRQAVWLRVAAGQAAPAVAPPPQALADVLAAVRDTARLA